MEPKKRPSECFSPNSPSDVSESESTRTFPSPGGSSSWSSEWEDLIQGTASLPKSSTLSQPVFMKRFQDGPSPRTYSGPGLAKPRLSPSQISFSPKWVNRVPSRFNSPSDIPASESTMTFLSESPGSSSWDDEESSLSSASENRLWQDFVEGTKTLPKSSTHILRKRVLNPHPGWSPQRRINRIAAFGSPTEKTAYDYDYDSDYDDEEAHPDGCTVVKMRKKETRE